MLNAVEWLDQPLFPLPFQIGFVSVMMLLKNTIEIFLN